MDLTKPEHEEFARISAEGGGFDKMLRKWLALVSIVERGYDDNIYEYTNDLAARDRLRTMVEAASDSLRRKLELRLQPVDERFFRATRPIDRSLRGNYDREGHPWWWVVPAKPGGELAEDLHSEGLA